MTRTRAGKKKLARSKQGWWRFEVDLKLLGKLMRAAGFICDEADPIAGHQIKDRAGRLRRCHASYANGWRATLSFRADGSHSLSMAIKLKSAPGDAA